MKWLLILALVAGCDSQPYILKITSDTGKSAVVTASRLVINDDGLSSWCTDCGLVPSATVQGRRWTIERLD